MSLKGDEKEKTSGVDSGQHDDLGVHLERREAEAQDWQKRFDAPSADKTSDLSPGGLNNQEGAPASPDITAAEADESQAVGIDDQGSYYKREPGKKTRRGLFSRRQKLIGGGLVGLVGSGGIIFVIFFAPLLRLESYFAKINDRVFSYATSAVERRTEHLFNWYMIKHVVNLDRCGNRATIDCRANYTGIAGGLFNTWRDAKIEEKLFDQYGLQIESTRNPDPAAGVHRFTLRDRFGREVKLTNADLQSGRFTGGSRELGRDFRHFLRENTKWHQVIQRRSVRNYMERKHGIKSWCFMACKTRDNVELRTSTAKVRYKYWFVNRFVYPFSPKYGFIMDCLISGTPGEGRCSAGELRKRIDRNALPDEEVNDIITRFRENPNTRLSGIVVEKLLAKVMSQQSAKAVVSAIPVAGQIYFALVVIDMLDRMDGFIENNGLSKFAANINAQQYLEYYAGMRSANDEIKSGALPLEDIGAITTDFDLDKSAEQSRVYQQRNNLPVLSDDTYRCADGLPIPDDELICEEKKVSRTFAVEDWRNNRIVDGLADILNRYGNCIGVEVLGRCPQGEPSKYIRPILGGIDKISSSIFGPLADGVLSAIKVIPGVSNIFSFAEGKFKEIMTAFFSNIFPLPIDVDSPGRDKHDGLWAGGEVAASEFGKGGYTETGEAYGLGAPALNPVQSGAIMEDFLAQEDYEHRKSNLLARLTDLSSPNSLLSKAVHGAPTNINQVPGNFASGISRAFNGLFNPDYITALFGKDRVLAQNTSENFENPFEITRYGYPLNDPAIAMDPDKLTDEYCAKAREAWEKSKTENPRTGIDEYTASNPCLLEYVSVEAAGAFLAQ